MFVRRSRFLRTAGAFCALPTAARAAAKTQASHTSHVHGLNGARLPLDRPINMRVRVLDGPDFVLADARGSVAVVNFFATWCPPCESETPDVVAFAQANASDTVTVGVDYAESDDTVRRWRKQYAIRYPLAMDQTGGYFRAIGLTEFPTTLFFRPDGFLSCVFVGTLNPTVLADELRYALDADPDPTAIPSAPASATPAPPLTVRD